jgi:hypothetical protein
MLGTMDKFTIKTPKINIVFTGGFRTYKIATPPQTKT